MFNNYDTTLPIAWLLFIYLFSVVDTLTQQQNKFIFFFNLVFEFLIGCSLSY